MVCFACTGAPPLQNLGSTPVVCIYSTGRTRILQSASFHSLLHGFNTTMGNRKNTVTEPYLLNNHQLHVHVQWCLAYPKTIGQAFHVNYSYTCIYI